MTRMTLDITEFLTISIRNFSANNYCRNYLDSFFADVHVLDESAAFVEPLSGTANSEFYLVCGSK